MLDTDASVRAEERHSQDQAGPGPENLHRPGYEEPRLADGNGYDDETEDQPLDPYDRLFLHEANLNMGGVGFGGRADVNAPVAGRDQHINILAGFQRRIVLPDTVRRHDLDELKRVYVEPDVYAQAHATLRTRHVVVLYGSASWGKSAMGLRLLDDVAAATIQRLDPRESLSWLQEGTAEKGFGYLAGLEGSQARELSSFSVERFANELRDGNGYLVITVDSDSVLPHELQVDYLPCGRPADATRVFVKHMAVRLGETDAAKWATDPRVRSRLSSSTLVPRQVADWADRAALFLDEQGTIEEALARFDEQAREGVSRWFRRKEDLGKHAFMTALAVLNGGSYQDVLDAAGQLESAFWKTERPGEPEGRELFKLTKADQIKMAHAESEQRLEVRSFGAVTTDAVRFKDRDYASIVFDEVWEYPVARGPVLEWLKKLAVNRRIRVQGPACMAIGRLSLANFDYVHDEVLGRWSGYWYGRHRQAVSWILTIPAGEPSLESAVRGLLDQWSDPGSSRSRRRTAASAYANLAGALSVETALEGLRRIGKYSDHPQVINAVSAGLTSLFDAGYPTKVLEAILDWTGPSSVTTKGSGLSTLALAGMVSFLEIAEKNAQGSRAGGPGVPALLVAAENDASLAEQLGRLWCRTLCAEELADDTRRVFSSWSAALDGSRRGADVLWPILDPFIRTDREIRRLRCCLGLWARKPRWPLVSANHLLRRMAERTFHDAD